MKLLEKVLADALTELEKSMEKNLKCGNGEVFIRLHLNIHLRGFRLYLDKYINIGPFRIGGDGTTIFNTQYPFQKG